MLKYIKFDCKKRNDNEHCNSYLWNRSGVGCPCYNTPYRIKNGDVFYVTSEKLGKITKIHEKALRVAKTLNFNGSGWLIDPTNIVCPNCECREPFKIEWFPGNKNAPDLLRLWCSCNNRPIDKDLRDILPTNIMGTQFFIFK